MNLVKSLFLLIFIGVSFTCISQTDLAPYFIYQKGATIKMGHFSQNKKPLGYTVYSVTDVNETDSITYITLQVESLDIYEKHISSMNFEAQCSEGGFSVNKLFLFPIDTLIAIDSDKYNAEGRDFIVPAFLGNGISLISAWAEIKTTDNLYYKVSEYSRVVEKFEKVKTGVGEFEACVISSKFESQFETTDFFTVYKWYAKGIGPVRINYYNKKRKPVKYSEIVEIDLPEKS